MQIQSENSQVIDVQPDSFKAQLKKLSSQTSSLKSNKVANPLATVKPDAKAQELKQSTSAKGKKRQSEQDTDNHIESATQEIAPSDSLLPSSSVVERTTDSTFAQAPVVTSTDAGASATPASTNATASTDTAASKAVGAAPSFSLAGVGAGLGGLAIAGGKGGSGGTSTSTATQTQAPVTLSGVIAAGPLLSNAGVKLEVFDANGKTLGSTTDIKADGSYSITFNKVYSGIVKLVVSDTNGNAANYVDEATGQPKDLGNTPLISIYNVTAGQTNLPVNVNTITTDIAKRVLSYAKDDLTSSMIATCITNAKLAFAKDFNIQDIGEVDNFFTDTPSLLIKADGSLNSNGPDKLGLSLAIKSYMDANPSFTFAQAVDALATSKTYSDKWSSLPSMSTISWGTYLHTLANIGFTSLNNLPTGAVTISGVPTTGLPTKGQVLTAINSIKDADGISGTGAITYQWRVSADGGKTWSDITGATSSTFTLSQDQVGKQVCIVASYTDDYGTPETVRSIATKVDIPPIGAVTISGAPTAGPLTQGQTLTAANNIEDTDGISGAGAITYQWRVSADGGKTWSDITGATSSSHTLTQDQVGKQAKVVASYTDNLGSKETIESSPTSQILSTFGTTSIPLSPQALGAVQTFSAGDLTGDGIADFLFLYRGGDVDKGGLPGKAYVIYGNTEGKFDLSGPSSGANSNTQVFVLEKALGREIGQPFMSTQTGILPTVVTDFNGNGLGEVAFATQRQVYGAPGQQYSVSGNYIDFSESLNSNSFPRIMNAYGDGSNIGTFDFGYNAISSGDLNGDGFADLIVSDPYLDHALGRAFVLYGKSTPYTGTIFTDGIRSSQLNGIYIIDSAAALHPDLPLGWAVSYLGDTNGDGCGDMAITRSYAGYDNQLEEIFVIYGGGQIKDIDVNQIRIGSGSSLGFDIKSATGFSFLGSSMSLNATKIYGDFNGDGRNDFIFEGNKYDHTAAKFYVVFGKTDSNSIDLNNLGNKGFTISLPSLALANVIFDDTNFDFTKRDMARDTATNCGDINGDGLDDILITLAFDTSIALDSAHKLNHFLAYVVYGKSNTNNIDLNTLDDKGTSSYGYKLAEYSKTIDASSNFYGNISAPGDINGDGIPDFIWDDYSQSNNLLPTVKLGSITNSLLGGQNKFTPLDTGTSGNDTLIGSSVDETFVGGAGNDAIYGNGGADVMYGGAGNDTFYLKQSNIDQLKLGISSSSGRLARIDGGGGTDTLTIDGSQITLDLTLVANSRLQSIEKINLGALNSNNTLKVSWSDVQNLAAMNLFNNTSGWSGFSDGNVPYHQLVVDGQSGSKVYINGTSNEWTKTTVIDSASHLSYDAYTNSSHAVQLLVNTSCGQAIFY